VDETPDGQPEQTFAAPADKLILAVDDDDGIRQLVDMIAKAQGFQIQTAVDGLEAAALIEKREPDLIVADLMMPRQGGYEFLRGLQASGNGRIPVIIITGSAVNSSTVAMLKQEGNVVEFVSKPIRAAAFAGMLHKHLGTAPSAKATEGGLNDRPAMDGRLKGF
jgi:CheY-like chemotaxis protein